MSISKTADVQPQINTTMRNITKESVKSFLNGENFKNGNTKVITDSFNSSRMYLHNTLIAMKHRSGKEELYISLAGYNTRVTRERLNGIPGVSINTKKEIPFLNGLEINENDMILVP